MDNAAARALLDWQIELGATEAIGDVPVDRRDLPKAPERKRAPVDSGVPTPLETADPVAIARKMAGGATSLDALENALGSYEHCDLRRGARNLVFSDGNAAARVMIIGEAPGRDEDREGRPFVGRAGQLLDLMLAAIGLGRGEADPNRAVYITNILPWRPPQNRDPEPQEIAMMLPFVERHIALAAPDLIVPMGNISCQALLGRKGITRLRGQWTEAAGRPALPMFHPAYLLRNAAKKREAWHDLLELQARLRGRP